MYCIYTTSNSNNITCLVSMLQLFSLEEFFEEEDTFFVYGSERLNNDDFEYDFEGWFNTKIRYHYWNKKHTPYLSVPSTLVLFSYRVPYLFKSTMNLLLYNVCLGVEMQRCCILYIEAYYTRLRVINYAKEERRSWNN